MNRFERAAASRDLRSSARIFARLIRSTSSTSSRTWAAIRVSRAASSRRFLQVGDAIAEPRDPGDAIQDAADRRRRARLGEESNAPRRIASTAVAIDA